MAFDNTMSLIDRVAMPILWVWLGMFSGVAMILGAVEEPIVTAVMEAEAERAPATITVKCRAVQIGERSCRLASIEETREQAK